MGKQVGWERLKGETKVSGVAGRKNVGIRRRNDECPVVNKIVFFGGIFYTGQEIIFMTTGPKSFASYQSSTN